MTQTAPDLGSQPSVTGDAYRPRVELDGLCVDLESYEVWLDGCRLNLPYLQFELLAELARHAGQVRLRRQLLTAAWGEAAPGEGRKLDVQLSRLRRHFDASRTWAIESVRRRGYRLIRRAN